MYRDGPVWKDVHSPNQFYSYEYSVTFQQAVWHGENGTLGKRVH